MHDLDLFLATDEFLATHPYYPCCLLVHPDIAVLTKAGQLLEQRYGLKSISIGSALSQALISIPLAERPRLSHSILQDVIRQQLPGPILFSSVDLLFEPTLKLDPFSLFRGMSRSVTLFILWPGTFTDTSLAYGTPEHAHYRVWIRPDLCSRCIIAL